MGAHQLLKEINRGTLSVGKLSKTMNETSAFTRGCLRYLEEVGEIRIDRTTRPYRITWKK